MQFCNCWPTIPQPVQTLPPGAGCGDRRSLSLTRRVSWYAVNCEQQNSLPDGREFWWSGQWKLSPQAHEPVALGLSMVKPCFSIVSTKSMVAPIRYGALMRSVTTSTPP